jgi:hypothetical protein
MMDDPSTIAATWDSLSPAEQTAYTFEHWKAEFLQTFKLLEEPSRKVAFGESFTAQPY